MFKQRLLTALLLAPGLLAVLFWGPPITLYAILFVVLMGAAYEWRQLIPITSVIASVIFVAVYVTVILMVAYCQPDWLPNLIFAWLPIFLCILLYPQATMLWRSPWVVALFSLIVSCLFAYAMQTIFTHPSGRYLLIYLILLVWAADIGAYLFGKLWGKHKLIPQVSPGKSWEGFLGGFLFVACISVVGDYLFQPTPEIGWFSLNFICFVVSIFGDLFISMLKRKCKLKDTGHLLPGHGGILDRIDSLIAAAPFFCVGIALIQFGH